MNKFTLTDYKELYNKLLDMSYDVEEFRSMRNLTSEEVEKLKFILAMDSVLSDVPLRKAKYYFETTKQQFNYDEILEQI